MNNSNGFTELGNQQQDDEDGVSLIDLAIALGESRRLLFGGPLLAGFVALGATYAIAPTYTARTVFMPPQQQQSAAASALQSLGSLAGLAGTAALKTPGDQYVALMQSATVSNRVIEAYSLKEAYEAATLEEARQTLATNVRMDPGKKDGLVTVDVSDTSPQRAANIANRYVEELRRLSSEMALTEAQQRRVFFEKQLQQTKAKLAAAQQTLQTTGVNERTLRVEPKAAAEAYATLRAQVTAAEIRLQSMRGSLTNEAPELKIALSNLMAMRSQLAKAEAVDQSAGNDAYVNAYREYKYQEMLFELFARQFELAKLDESREGALIQVVDTATPPERKAKPKRGSIAVSATLVAGIGIVMFIFARNRFSKAKQDQAQSSRLAELKNAWKS
jgi:uncharacterized protein involved in exopolysaccharide biosynthesis